MGPEGSGWTPGHTIGFCQSVAIDPPSADNCDGRYTTVTADGSGDVTATVVVRATIHVPSLGVDVSCTDPSNPCAMGAADVADVAGTARSVPLVFARALGAPTIGAAAAGDGQATVSWSAPSSDGGSQVSGYEVTPYVGTAAQPAVTFLSSALSQTITGLKKRTAYTFTVRAINAVGTGPPSGPTGAVVIGTPGSPAPVTAQGGVLTATVSWTVPADNGSAITGYTVFVGIPGSFSQERIVTVGPTATSVTISALTAGSERFFRVAAIKAVGTGPFARTPGPITIGP